MPAVAADLDALSGYTWAFNAFVVASLLAMVAGGLWSDATGPRGPLITGVAALAAGAVIAGVAVDLLLLVVGRALQGVGGGFVIVAVYVLIARAYPAELRAKAFSVLSAAWILPSLLGPLVAGWLADTFSWRAVFWIVPFFVIPSLLLLFPRLGEFQGGVPHASARRRLAAGVVATAGLLAIQDGVLRLSPAGFAEAIAGAVVMVLAVRHLLPPGALVFRRGLPASVMMRGLIASAYFSAEVFIPLALTQTRGISITQAGLILATSAAMWSVGSYLQSRLPADRDRASAVRLGSAIVVLSLATLPLSVATPLPPWVAAISWAVGALGMGLAVPSVSVQVMRLSPESDLGVNSSSIQIIDSVLSVVVISVLGVWHASAVASGGATVGTYVWLWIGSAAVAATAVILAGRMRPVARAV